MYLISNERLQNRATRTMAYFIKKKVSVKCKNSKLDTVAQSIVHWLAFNSQRKKSKLTFKITTFTPVEIKELH
jgi:hypothetical protein